MAGEDDPLTPEFLLMLAKTYVAILEGVQHSGVHGIDSVGLEKIRMDLGLEKHHFLAALSQMCQGGIIATDDQTKFFATKDTEAFIKLFRSKVEAMEGKKIGKRADFLS